MPNYNYPYQQYYQQQNYPVPVQQQATQQIQNNGFVSVRSEEEARCYPVGIGNSVTFKDESAPYVYTKTMGFSQLDRPTFEKYKLVKEETETETSELSELDKVKSDIREIWGKLDEIENARKKNQPQPKSDRNGEH